MSSNVPDPIVMNNIKILLESYNQLHNKLKKGEPLTQTENIMLLSFMADEKSVASLIESGNTLDDVYRSTFEEIKKQYTEIKTSGETISTVISMLDGFNMPKLEEVREILSDLWKYIETNNIERTFVSIKDNYKDFENKVYSLIRDPTFKGKCNYVSNLMSMGKVVKTSFPEINLEDMDEMMEMKTTFYHRSLMALLLKIYSVENNVSVDKVCLVLTKLKNLDKTTTEDYTKLHQYLYKALR